MSPNQTSPSGPSLQSSGNPAEERAERLQGVEGMEDTKKIQPTESTKQGTYGLIETETASKGPCMCLHQVVCIYGVSINAWWDCGIPDCGSGCIFDSFAYSWDSFPPVGLTCPVSIRRLSPCFTVFCFVVVSCCLLEACFFSEGRQRGCGSGGEVGWVWQAGRREGNHGWDLQYERRTYFH